MTISVEQNRRARTLESEAAAASSTQATSNQKAPSRPLAGPELTAGASGLIQQHRANTVRAAVTEMARQLPGHGVDVEGFVQRLAGSRSGSQSKAQLTAAARLGFMRAALGNDPALADRAIEMRTRGLPDADRQIAKLAAAQSGAQGLSKYAEAERALRGLSGFDPEERKDILGLMRSGARFDSAVAEEKRTLAKIAPEEKAHASAPKPRSLDAQRAEAASRVRAEAGRWREVNRNVNVAMRSLPRITDTAEIAVGAGAAAGSVGTLGWGYAKSAISGDGSHFDGALNDVTDAGSYLAGELTNTIRKAEQLYAKFSKQHLEYADQSKRLERAIQQGDYDTINRASARTQTLEKEMTGTVRAFQTVSKKLEKMDAKFDKDAVNAAIGLAVSFAGLGAGLGSEPAKITLGSALSGATKEAAIAEGASQLRPESEKR